MSLPTWFLPTGLLSYHVFIHGRLPDHFFENDNGLEVIKFHLGVDNVEDGLDKVALSLVQDVRQVTSNLGYFSKQKPPPSPSQSSPSSPTSSSSSPTLTSLHFSSAAR